MMFIILVAVSSPPCRYWFKFKSDRVRPIKLILLVGFHEDGNLQTYRILRTAGLEQADKESRSNRRIENGLQDKSRQILSGLTIYQ